jgi:CheY-like chemotaxis protein
MGVNVLYAEDEEDDIFFMRQAFTRSGREHTLHVVENGAQAIAFLRGEPPYHQMPRPDVVLLDLNMPLVSGFEVLFWIRRRSAFSALPVFIFSSSSFEEDREKARVLGATGYFVKPSSGLKFSECVSALFEAVAQLTPSGNV